MSENISGLQLLKQARKQDGKFVLQELDETLTEIVAAIRQAPHQGGSLNINIKLEPQSEDGLMITTTAAIKGVKKPVVPPRPSLAYTTKDGKMSNQDPTQGQMFDEEHPRERIDQETGEVKPVDSKISSIKQVKNGDKK
jgi:hypothetical protein